PFPDCERLMEWMWFAAGLLAGGGGVSAWLLPRLATRSRDLDLAQRTASLDRKAAAAVESSEARLRHLIDVVPAAFFLTNLDGECVLVNQHWRVLTGLPDEVSIGHGWISAIHPEDVARVTS